MKTIKLTQYAYGGRPPGSVMTLEDHLADTLIGRGVAVEVPPTLPAPEPKAIQAARVRNKAMAS